MNEFIVWDEEEKEFIDDYNKLCIAFHVVDKNFFVQLKNGFTKHNAIGIEDINNKKIYADCSIVEFYFGNDLDDEVLVTGYFSFNYQSLRYEIKDVQTKEAIYLWTGYTESCLKIIDTIQENKLGLIKEVKEDE